MIPISCSIVQVLKFAPMGLAPIRFGKRDQARRPCSGEPDGGKPHPYYYRSRNI